MKTMNSNETLLEWSSLSLADIEQRLLRQAGHYAAAGDDAGRGQPRTPFAAEDLEEMLALLGEAPYDGPREAVVLLPGIMGSLLTSMRGVTKLLWINPLVFLHGEANYLEMNDDGSGDGCAEVQVMPLALEKIFYTKLALALRREVDLYEFPYDWRRSITWNARQLQASLARWSLADPGRQFTLVGHSMGGLVIRAYLAQDPAGAEQHVRQVISLGTPYYGATSAVENLLLGNRMLALVAGINPRNVPRRIIMNMPSIYELLPPPPEMFPAGRPYPVNWDLYNAAAWHKADVRQDYLDLGCQFQQLMAVADPQLPQAQIAGCHLKTLVAVRQQAANGSPQYELVKQPTGPNSGDGTVPLWSAIRPEFDTYYVRQEHCKLPGHKPVIQAALALIHDELPELPSQLPPAPAGLFDAAVDPFMAAEMAPDAATLRQRLAEGTATASDYAQLFFAL
jgi:pimeloyl-ACP methyl ester carboxylesterase